MSHRQLSLAILLALSLAACNSGAATPTLTPAPSPRPGATVAPTASPTMPPSATPTAALEAATATATASANPAARDTPSPTAGTPATAAAATGSPAAATQSAGTDKADFVVDVSVPDGTTFTAGQAFVKTWQLKNSGTNAWTSAYALVYVRGDQMGGAASTPLSGTVAPGANVEISLNLTAPNKLGSFTGFWMLRNAAGKLFGLGADANQPVYIKINVGAAPGTPLPTAAAGALSVTAASLSVDPASFTGACPHTFNFNGSLTSSGAGAISYQLEASSDKPGFVFDLPKPVSATISGAGPRTFSVSYQLQFTGSVGGQAWLHVLRPNDLSSARVNFSLTCQP